MVTGHAIAAGGHSRPIITQTISGLSQRLRNQPPVLRPLSLPAQHANPNEDTPRIPTTTASTAEQVRAGALSWAHGSLPIKGRVSRSFGRLRGGIGFLWLATLGLAILLIAMTAGRASFP